MVHRNAKKRGYEIAVESSSAAIRADENQIIRNKKRKGFLPLWHSLKRDEIVSDGFGLLMRDGIQKNTDFHRRYSNQTTVGKTRLTATLTF